MQYLLGLIFPILSIFLQTYPRFFNKYFGVDVWTRLLEIEHVRRARHRVPHEIKQGFIIKGEFDYPILFPFIFSFFPKKILLKFQGFVSPFFDAIQNLLVFYLTYSISGSLLTSLLAQAMYSVIPIIPIENSYLTPRSLGYLNFTLAFFPIFMFHINRDLILLLISLFFTCLLFLTHRFALQSFVFISVFFTIVDFSFFYIINILLAFLIVVALTRGFYLRVLRGHMYNIYFWVINYKYRFAHQIRGISSVKRNDLVGKIYILLSFLSPVFLFAINIWAFAAVLYLIFYFKGLKDFPANSIYFKMSIWIIFFYLFGSIVLRFKRLIPIGEGQRYMEMASVPSVILSAVLFFYFFESYLLPSLVLLIILLLGNLGLILFIQFKGIINDKNRSLTKDLISAYKFINSLKKPRIICIPHQITTMTVYNTNAQVLVNADNKGLMQIMDVYPLLNKPISYLKKKYKLDYLLLREGFASIKELKIKKPRIVFRSGDVVLIKL